MNATGFQADCFTFEAGWYIMHLDWCNSELNGRLHKILSARVCWTFAERDSHLYFPVFLVAVLACYLSSFIGLFSSNNECIVQIPLSFNNRLCGRSVNIVINVCKFRRGRQKFQLKMPDIVKPEKDTRQYRWASRMHILKSTSMLCKPYVQSFTMFSSILTELSHWRMVFKHFSFTTRLPLETLEKVTVW